MCKSMRQKLGHTTVPLSTTLSGVNHNLPGPFVTVTKSTWIFQSTASKPVFNLVQNEVDLWPFHNFFFPILHQL